MKNPFGLPSEDYQQLHHTFYRFPDIHDVKIYGSRASGHHQPASDIDLTIMDPIDWRTMTQLETALDDLLLPYQIDLSVFTQIDNPDLIDHIQRIGKTFFKR